MNDEGSQDQPKEQAQKHQIDKMESSVRRSLSGAFRSIYFSLLLIFVAIAIASFLPNRRLWGINHLAFFSLRVRTIALFLMACSFMPPVYLAIYRVLEKLLKTIMRERTVYILGATVLIVILLFILQARTQLLNENEFLSPILKGRNSAGIITTAPISEIITREHIAPGTLIIYILASRISSPPTKGVLRGALYLSLILGGIFFLRLLRFIGQLKVAPPVSILLLFLLLFSGNTMLFAGYLSRYLFLYVFGAFYVLSSFRLIQGKGTIVGPAVFFALSILMHTLGVLLAPSFAFLVLSQYARKTGNRFIHSSWLSLIFLTLLAALAGVFMQKLKGIYLPPIGSEETDGVLSPGHIIDILNVLILILPALPLLFSIPAVNAKLSGSIGFSSADAMKGYDGKISSSWKLLDMESRFALLLFFSWMIFLLLFNPSTSMARGWDRFGLAALGVFPLMAIGLKKLAFYIDAAHSKLKLTAGQEGQAKASDPRTVALGGKAHKQLEALTYRGYASFVSPAVIMSIIMSLSWTGINMSKEKSATRFNKILAFEKKSAAHGYMQLALYYSVEQKFSKAIQYTEKSVAIKPERDSFLRLSLLYISVGDSANAIDKLNQCLSIYPDFPQARHTLISLLDAQKRFKEIIEVCKKGIEFEPEEPQYYYFMGKGYLFTGNIPRGVRALLKCRDMNPSKKTMSRINNLMNHIHRKDR